MHWPPLAARLRPHIGAGLPGLLAVGVMLVWVAHDGGYDTDTWYWGALFLLGLLAVTTVTRGGNRLYLSRPTWIALIAFGLYVGWSYLSISWAQSPADALQGSNRSLLYLLVFALFVTLPWTTEASLAALLLFVLGVGAIAILTLAHLASGSYPAGMFTEGRLSSPTGYFNSTAALFTIVALLAIALAARRELPGLLRGALLAIACAGLQLALIGESRGWLFTLPAVLIAVFAVVGDRLRVAAASLLPVLVVLLPLHRLLALYQAHGGAALNGAARRAGHISLLLCAAAFFAGTLIAWGETLRRPRNLARRRRRQLGSALVALTVAIACSGAVIATKGDPAGFIKRQWHGFIHTSYHAASGSYFGTVGSGRYDYWRVSLNAVAAHPVGGLGQDNFADYYVTRRRTGEEPQWTHSLEMRALAHTGLVGFGLLATLLTVAAAAALQARRRVSDPARWIVGASLIPLTVWLIHGSVDWFWEMPALTGPALGFLGMAAALAIPGTEAARAGSRWRPIPSFGRASLGPVALITATAVLGVPYLSVREVSRASDLRASNPSAALSALTKAANLNPLSPDPGRIGGMISLQTGRLIEAERRFSQAIARERGGWFAWLGDGLAASALGDCARAAHDFKVASSINSLQPAVKQALARVNTTQPLTPAQALRLLVLVG